MRTNIQSAAFCPWSYLCVLYNHSRCCAKTKSTDTAYRSIRNCTQRHAWPTHVDPAIRHHAWNSYIVLDRLCVCQCAWVGGVAIGTRPSAYTSADLSDWPVAVHSTKPTPLDRQEQIRRSTGNTSKDSRRWHENAQKRADGIHRDEAEHYV